VYPLDILLLLIKGRMVRLVAVMVICVENDGFENVFHASERARGIYCVDFG
jgi:hypothetical protein